MTGISRPGKCTRCVCVAMFPTDKENLETSRKMKEISGENKKFREKL